MLLKATGGLGDLLHPLVLDLEKSRMQTYGVLLDEGVVLTWAVYHPSRRHCVALTYYCAAVAAGSLVACQTHLYQI